MHQGALLALEMNPQLLDRGGVLCARISDALHEYCKIFALCLVQKRQHVIFVGFFADHVGLETCTHLNNNSKKGGSLKFLNQLLHVPSKNVHSLGLVSDSFLNN